MITDGSTARPVRVRMPLRRRHSIVYRWPSGTTAVVTVRWTTSRDWLRSPDAREPGWQLIPIGRRLIAVRAELTESR